VLEAEGVLGCPAFGNQVASSAAAGWALHSQIAQLHSFVLAQFGRTRFSAKRCGVAAEGRRPLPLSAAATSRTRYTNEYPAVEHGRE